MTLDFGGECGSRTHSTAHHHRRISNPMPYHPAHSPCVYYNILQYVCQRCPNQLLCQSSHKGKSINSRMPSTDSELEFLCLYRAFSNDQYCPAASYTTSVNYRSAYKNAQQKEFQTSYPAQESGFQLLEIPQDRGYKKN